MMYTKGLKTLRRAVKTYYSQNYLYFIHNSEIIEIKVNKSSFGQKLALALNKSKEIEDTFKKFLSEEESSQLIALLHESDMLIEDKWEIPDFYTSELEIPIKIKPRDTLTNIYQALDTLNENGVKLFSQTYVVSFSDSKNSLWEKRKVKVNKTLVDQYSIATVRINNKGQSVYGFGFSSNGKTEALAIAMLESLERLYTMYRIPEATVCDTSYSQLKTTAINPTRLNWFSEAQYNSIGFEFSPFSTSLPLNWLEATSLSNNTTTLIPRESIVSSHQDKKFIPSNSNGCAIHSSMDSALIAGIEEIIERDTLLKIWYHQLSMPRILDTDNLIKASELGQLLISMGFKITLLDGASDIGVPVIIGIFEDKENESLFTVNAATGLTQEMAIEKLFKEFCILWRDYMMESNVREIECMLPSDVKNLSQHFDFHQRLKYKKERQFLTASHLEIKSAQIPWMNFDNAKQHLEHLTQIISEKGLEILKVDCSSKFLKKLGLVAVKVMIIGTIPLFAGANLPMGINRFQLNKYQLNELPHPYC